MQQRAARGAVAVALAVGACGPSGPAAVVHTARGPVTVALEVAHDDATRTRGLMYRDRLPDAHGMLFVFDEVSDHMFWMKNTVIPLDMIFIGSDGRVVGVHENATPLSLSRISVGRPSKWVLEVAGGYAGRAGIATGDAVELVGIP
jgi:uncharacterized membrane protein (UPF0127 family)